MFTLRLRWYILQLRLLLKPKQVKRNVKAKWLGDLRPVGLDPLEFVHVWKNWACKYLQLIVVSHHSHRESVALDDCDYNMHLSNSCYAKVRLDKVDSFRISTMNARAWIVSD